MTRRDFITTSIAAIYLQNALGRVIRSSLSSHKMFIGTNSNAIFPYVSDGLITMWDGEWNEGFGIHSNENRCYDLSENGHDGLFWGEMTHKDNYFWVPKSDEVLLGALYSNLNEDERLSITNECTIECVFETCLQSDFHYDSLYHRYLSVASFLTCGQFVNGNIFYGYPIWGGNYNFGGFGKRMSLRMMSIGNNASISNNIGSKRTWTITNSKSLNIFGLCGSEGLNRYNYVENGVKFYSFRLYSKALTSEDIRNNDYIDKLRFGL